MIKQKKKNKFILFMCSIMLCFCSVFTLFNNSIGTTYAAAPTITLDYFDYTQDNYYDNYLGVWDIGQLHSLINFETDNSSYTKLIYSNNFTGNNIVDFQYQFIGLYLLDDNNVITSITSDILFRLVVNTSNVYLNFTGSNYSNNVSSLLNAKHWICVSYMNVFGGDAYYIVYSPSLYNSYLTYTAGKSDGNALGYSDGVTAGQNNVINNPNSYNLYTKEQYDNSYNNGYDTGYDEGVAQGRNNIISNPNEYGLYTSAQMDANYNLGYNVGKEDVTNNPNNYNLYTKEQYDNNYQAGVIQGQNNVINNPNNYNLYTKEQYDNNYQSGVTQGQNNVINNPNDYGLYTLDQLNSRYSDGIIVGQNNVINDPNNFDLYTNEQYDNNYNLGFIAGKNDSENYQDGYNKGLEEGFDNGYNEGLDVGTMGVFANSVTTINVRSTTSIDGVPTFNRNFDNALIPLYNSLVINPDLLNTSSEFYNLSNDYLYNIYVDLDKPFVYDNTLYNFGYINNAYVEFPTSVEYWFVDKDNNNYIGTYIVTPVYSNEDKQELLTYNVTDNYPVDAIGKEIVSISIVSTTNNSLGSFIKSNGIQLYQNTFGYNLGYDVGYKEGSSSEKVTSAYNEGYTTGNRVGYQQGLSNGLANSNDYTFFGLIGAVVDAPIQYLTNLFNFNILGFNMWAFFTSLITAVFVIWIIRMLLGGK